jgi:hypothetical protein
MLLGFMSIQPVSNERSLRSAAKNFLFCLDQFCQLDSATNQLPNNSYRRMKTVMQMNPSQRRLLAKFLPVAVLTALIVPAARADYPSTVLADNPKAYYRLNDDTNRSNTNKNSGSIGSAGDLTNTFNVNSFPGALAGNGNRSQFYNNGTSYGMIPFNAALNPDNTQPFTIEAWLYPASDQINGGQCPINNRVSSGFPDRTGWVFFQRAPNLEYAGRPGYEGVGWNCRMYRGSGGNSGLDVTSQVPYEVGKWAHVVVVYDPVDITNATLTMYINGEAANTNIWNGGPNGTDPGYVANPAVTDAALSLGAYNNTSGAGNNPYFGGVDEFAFYAAKLTPAQILSQYQNGTNANRATPYDALVKSHNPVVYLRLDEIAPGADVAINMGDLRNAGLATHTAEVRHPATAALAGRADDGAIAYHNRNGNSVTTMPWRLENNPGAGVPFTFEAWLRPMRDQQQGQCPVNNRWVGGTGRTGWVIFQRNPNLTYPASEGHGWNFRMYSGQGSSGQDVLTDTDYQIGKWQHLVVTWEPQTDNGDPGANGNNQWQGILTAYVDGVPVASNTAALYAANREISETGSPAADLGIGAYNAASVLGNNPYEGDIDELAIYNNLVLTPEQILAHYQAGTNTQSGTNYETLVLMAGSDGIGTQRLGPKTYLRFNDPARFPAANNSTAGSGPDGNLVLTTNTAAGPQPPAYAGFEASNTALALDGLKQWGSLNNPPSLNISGQITLEAWVKPAAVQGETARIISHGPKTPSNFLTAVTIPDNAVTNSTEVFLRIDGTGANYTVGSIEITYTNAFEVGSNIYSASFPIPAGDLGGSDWIHLVGTYDGANWKLYRNGAQVASQPATVGALAVDSADWAIGSTGNGWADNFAGGIDEVAIYDKALTLSQVAAHHMAGKVGTAPITITKGSGNNVIITWPAGTTLLESTSVTGPYTNVPGSPVSPLTVPASGTKFYRWRL